MRHIEFISAKDNPVTGEFEGEAIRERLAHEPVHYRAENKDANCAKCGMLASVWLESETRWEQHLARCQ